MAIAQPTGGYAEQMLNVGGWPQVDEDAFYDRARDYTQALRQLAEVSENCRRQRSEIFNGDTWSGAAANAADGELGTRVGELTTLQDGLATVITWHRYIAESILDAKSDISDNVEEAHRQISALENDPSLDAAELAGAINVLLRAAHEANVSLVADTAERIRLSKTWTPPSKAVEDLLDQKTPPPLTPLPEENETPQPGQTPPAPVAPEPAEPGRPVQPTPQTAAPNALPQFSITPTPFAPAPTSVSPAPVPDVPPTEASDPGDGPSIPLNSPAPAHLQGGGGRGKGMAPASVSVAPAAPPSAGVVREDLPVSTPAAATGLPPTPVAAAPSGGGAAGRGTGSGAGAPVEPKASDKRATTRPAAASRLAGRAAAYSNPGDRFDAMDAAIMAAPVPVSAARAQRDAIAEASTADAARRRSGGTDPLRLARRIAAALNAPGGGEADFGFFWVTAVTADDAIVVANSYGLAYIPDGVQLPESVHLATADEAITATERACWATYPVLAVQGWADHHNTTLRAVIGTEEQLANTDPGAAKIVLTSDDIPASGNMIGRSRLEVVDAEAATRLAGTADARLVELLPPAPAAADASDKQSPSEILDPDAATQLSDGVADGTLDLSRLFALADGAPTTVHPPADQRPMLWFEVMKPMTSSATGRHTAHLRAFRAYCLHAQEIVLKEAHAAAEPSAQRAAVADWLYWKHLTGLLDAAVAEVS